jgi:MinD superfamily P-loop ATPase
MVTDSVLLVDTDVDSPTTATVLGVKPQPVKEVKVFIPEISEVRCSKCGRCAEACRAHALIQITDKYPLFFEELCSGCKTCLLVCPEQAIENGRRAIGRVLQATGSGINFVGGELNPGETRSAKVVTATKDLAFRLAGEEDYDIIVIDTPSGTHCNVVQSLRGSDLALAVTEPTPLGVYDLDLILKLTSRIGIPTRVIINKADLPGQDKVAVHKISEHYSAHVDFEVPVDHSLFESYVNGKPVVLERPHSPAAVAIRNMAESILDQMKVMRSNHVKSRSYLHD